MKKGFAFSLFVESAAALLLLMMSGSLSAWDKTPAGNTCPRAIKEKAWKTYIQGKYGYSISYPEDWRVIEALPRSETSSKWGADILFERELQKVTFIEEGKHMWPGEFQVRVLANPDLLDFKAWIEKHGPKDACDGDLVMESEEITLNSRPAYRFKSFMFDHTALDIACFIGDKIFLLSYVFTTPNDPELEQHLTAHKKMEESFCFRLPDSSEAF